MENNKFIELAKTEVVKYHNHHQDPVIWIDESLVYVVWSCKTLQNHKALMGVAKPDGDMYYEITYNGDCGEMYFDAYKKEKNICIKVDDPKLGDTEKDRTEGKKPTTMSGIKYNSPYEKTVEGMLSANYKERFKAEYTQTKIRYEKLKAFCNRIEAARHTMGSDSNKIEEPKHDCPFDLLRGQQRAMGEYLHYLEIRAVIEGIEL